ncbi:ATP-binding protein [Acetobacter farinalis]|uniref:histidine kinase n=1 Tax=Acetobacter farinalis TaxID=1260984 RepID=A0ABT3Q6I3_9PROT|nr:ATP-binding protein [Acetobacter farinalis]MCX2560891.1 ATP-binding protein [Acetobacter farinalis]NHO29540.1 two-component sensor histidine kinase [Acetobacter farinalis]
MKISKPSQEGSGPGPGLLLDSLPVAVLELGPANELRFANAAAEEFFATSRHQLCQSTLTDLVPEDHPLFLLVQHVRGEGCTITEHELVFSSPRFHHEGVTVQGADVLDYPGSVLLTFHDSSAARALDRQLAFRSAARSVSGMAEMLAHEVRNPLSGIKGAAQILEHSVGEGDKELATLICDEVDRIDALVERIGMFGEAPTEYRSLNIHRVLEHVRLLASKGCAAGLRIVERYDPSLPHVWGNRDQLVQMLLNLVKNAAEAIRESDKPGEITLSTSYRPGIRLAIPGTTQWRHLPLVVTVRDTGPGISETIRPHLFEPFISTKMSGSGLGLALVGKIMDDHGGVIEVESRPGRTEISLYLPVVPEGHETA